ncbi:MAG TPA: hypothetical protein VKA31_09745, partial [Mariprofundaceae bacterium]|nr:hypothetical protein [Mariprofundaceae bacterium]
SLMPVELISIPIMPSDLLEKRATSPPLFKRYYQFLLQGSNIKGECQEGQYLYKKLALDNITQSELSLQSDQVKQHLYFKGISCTSI